MTVLSAVQQASMRIGVSRPDQLYAGTSRTQQELAAMANDVAAMIAFESGHDWTALKTVGTITGDGAALSFALPSDYRRMLKKARLWPSASPNAPFTHVPDTDTWFGMITQSFQPVIGMWTLIGDEIHIRGGGNNTPMGTGETAQFYYLSRSIARNGSGTAKTVFTEDTDTFRLDERLLTKGIIWSWKKQKRQDYAEDLNDYQDLLAERIGADKGSNIIVVGRQTAPDDWVYAFPGTVGI